MTDAAETSLDAFAEDGDAPVGMIYGEVGTNGFRFGVTRKVERSDYVVVDHPDVGPVLCQVGSIVRKTNLTLDKSLEMDPDARIEEKLSAQADVIGYRDEKGLLQVPRTTFKAGSDVRLADAKFIKKVLGLKDNPRTCAYVGLLRGYDMPLMLDINELVQRHVCILAKTGGGKSYISGDIIEELMKHDVTCMIIDPHGEYGAMRDPGSTTDPRFGVKPRGFADRILEFGMIDAPNVRPLKFTFKTLDARDILDLLSSTDTKTHLPTLKKAIDALREKKGLYSVRDLIDEVNEETNGRNPVLISELEYLDSIGEAKRKVCLIPRSAHGTNPASAAMNGMTVVEVNNLSNGAIDLPDLEKKIAQYKDTLACIMITYPSTYGIFDEGIKDIVKKVHNAGAQVYMDGANMNAQVGHTCPGVIGADVCHLNLHKTFSMPHGGGGPGVGAIGVAKHLVPFLPTNPTLPVHSGAGSIVSGAPYGNANLLPITWMYLRMLGIDGLRKNTACAILNANYMAARLSKDYNVMFRGKQGMCGHEFILDVKPFEQYGITETEIAKRLMDYGFHAPTMSFPVHGSLMVEPTESEDKQMLDRFCDALIMIRKEIQDIADGKLDKDDNPLKNAPHTAQDVISDKWNHKYSRELAAYPTPETRENKYWPTCGQVDNTWGDRKLLFTVDSFKN